MATNIYPEGGEDEPGWPPGVRAMTLEAVGRMGVDRDGRLYWEGKPIEIAKTFSLSWWQKIGAAIGVAAAAIVAAVELLRFLGLGWDRV